LDRPKWLSVAKFGLNALPATIGVIVARQTGRKLLRPYLAALGDKLAEQLLGCSVDQKGLNCRPKHNNERKRTQQF
jgi:hypothetical protein